jgi:hypothetical protein
MIEGMTRSTAEAMVAYFKRWHEDVKLPSIYRTNEKLERRTGIKPVWIDCCVNSCIAYTGEFASDEICTQVIKTTKEVCNQPRYFDRLDKWGNNVARKRYLYLPLEGRLRHQFSTKTWQPEEMSTYRASFDSRPNGSNITDCFDGELYQGFLRVKLGLFTQ